MVSPFTAIFLVTAICAALFAAATATMFALLAALLIEALLAYLRGTDGFGS